MDKDNRPLHEDSTRRYTETEEPPTQHSGEQQRERDSVQLTQAARWWLQLVACTERGAAEARSY